MEKDIEGRKNQSMIRFDLVLLFYVFLNNFK